MGEAEVINNFEGLFKNAEDSATFDTQELKCFPKNSVTLASHPKESPVASSGTRVRLG
jgi:hypothetical protein